MEEQGIAKGLRTAKDVMTKICSLESEFRIASDNTGAGTKMKQRFISCSIRAKIPKLEARYQIKSRRYSSTIYQIAEF